MAHAFQARRSALLASLNGDDYLPGDAFKSEPKLTAAQQLWKECEADPRKMAEMMMRGAAAAKEKRQRIGNMISSSNRDCISSAATMDARDTKAAARRPRAGQLGHLQ